jgi:RimJ/RimL family protein N-acetyltransferase
MFQRRIEAGHEIHMHELIYPVLQGYDSVVIRADLTIIGSDQLFNEMMGRFFQEKFKQKPQTIVTTKITPGIDGKGKQSKSVGNYIGLAHSPRDKFGRVMSIPDKLILDYFRIYTDLPDTELEDMKKMIDQTPRDAKMHLAYSIVSRYHGHDTALNEQNWFENTFSKGKVPDDIPTLSIINPRIDVLDLVVLARPGKSKGDSRRLIRQGAVELNSKKLTDPEQQLFVQTNDVLQIGKRNWFRIEVVRLNDLETEHLWMRPLELRDLDLLQKYIPDWDIVKYLGNMPETKIPKKVADPLAREVFKRVIIQPEPKDEWLWKIIPKEEPEKIAGVVHLRRDFARGNHNIWLAEKYRTSELMEEAVLAVNEHAFNALGFNSMVFQEAFAHAAAPRMLEAMRNRFSGIDEALKSDGTPDSSWGFSRDAWEQMRIWWQKNNATALEADDAPDNLAKKMEAAKKSKNMIKEQDLKNLQTPFPPIKPKPTSGGGKK